MNEIYSPEDNARALKAWNEWKEICSVMGCSEESRSILKKEISGAFRYFLMAINSWASRISSQFENVPTEDDDVYVQEFDTSIEIAAKNPGINKHTHEPKEHKYYKDKIWMDVQNSNDAPLKVIRGELISKNNKACVIKGVVINYLEKNCSFKVVIEDKKPKVILLDSLSKEVKNSKGENLTLEDQIGDSDNLVVMKPLDNSDLEEFRKRLLSEIEITDAALFLASASGMTLENDTLLRFLQRSKTTAYEMLKTAQRKIWDIFQDLAFAPEDIPAVMEIIPKELKMILSAEKTAHDLLCEIEERNPNL